MNQNHKTRRAFLRFTSPSRQPCCFHPEANPTPAILLGSPFTDRAVMLREMPVFPQMKKANMRNTLTSMFALLLMAHAAMGDDDKASTPQTHFKGPVKVFILAGQSNMEGQGSVDHDYNEGKGNLVWSMKHSKSADKMKKLKNEKGEWVVRDDVQISFKIGDKVLKSATSTCETRGGRANSGCFVRGFTG